MKDRTKTGFVGGLEADVHVSKARTQRVGAKEQVNAYPCVGETGGIAAGTRVGEALAIKAHFPMAIAVVPSQNASR